jgi:methyl-accepting chemotaxis protein
MRHRGEEAEMKRPKSTKRKGKGFWLTGLLFLVLLGSGAASIYYLFQINNELKVVLKHEVPLTEMVTRITVHKLEQTSWLERALRHAEIEAHSQENDEENTRLLKEAKAKFKEFTVKVNEEIDTASNMSAEAQKLAQAEELMVELRRVDELLASIREEYADYIKRVNELFTLFANGYIRDAEKIANETEKLEEGFNQRLESFLFGTEEITRRSLSSIGEREGKAIIVIALTISITLVLTIVAILLNSNKGLHRR